MFHVLPDVPEAPYTAPKGIFPAITEPSLMGNPQQARRIALCHSESWDFGVELVNACFG